MRTFRLYREKDNTGISGTGIVGEGCLLTDERVIFVWYGVFDSIAIHSSLEKFAAISCGHSNSRIVWD